MRAAIAIFIWIAAIICIIIMKKIQPQDKIYPIWAVVISILVTLQAWLGG